MRINVKTVQCAGTWDVMHIGLYKQKITTLFILLLTTLVCKDIFEKYIRKRYSNCFVLFLFLSIA